ncbi:MAG: Methicillin resistance protein [Bacteroidetes bacterium]|nr:Methicillin resistance protein [Bacteroidota bacterium]
MGFIFTNTLTDEQTNSILALYRASEPVSIEQYPGFAEANTDNNVIHYIQKDEAGRVSAYTQIDMRQYRIAAIAFGPIASSGEAYRNALTDIKQYCRSKLTPILRITPPYFISQYGDAYYEDLRKAIGFETSEKEINWSTLVLSTAPSEEEILKGFADNHRQSVKKAIKMGLEAELVSDTDMIDIFSGQHSDMYQNRGLAVDRNKSKVHFRKLFDFFEKNDLGYFVIVKEGEKVIGGVCCVIQGNAVRYLEGYSHPDYRKYPISHIALYEAIKIAKRRGISFFDFGGYANNVQEGDQLYAINKFKEAFRGEQVDYPKTMLIFTLPLAKWLYSMKKG